jgi:hypothetical protein
MKKVHAELIKSKFIPIRYTDYIAFQKNDKYVKIQNDGHVFIGIYHSKDVPPKIIDAKMQNLRFDIEHIIRSHVKTT